MASTENLNEKISENSCNDVASENPNTALLKEDLDEILHDLFKPFTPILGFLEMLLEEQEHLTDDHKLYITHIYSSAQYLKFLIEEIRDASYVSRGFLVPKIKKVNLNNILDQMEGYAFSGKGVQPTTVNLIKSQFPSNIEVYTDEVKLKRIFYNLISNAKEFTTDSIEIGFTYGPADPTNQNTYYVGFVKDNGSGMSEEIQQKLNKKDYELVQNPHRIYSSGIGLKTSKELAQILGGELLFNSIKGKGTNFYFTFKDMRNEYQALLGETYKKEQ